MVEVEIRTCMESTEECINKIEQSGFKKEKVINQHDIMLDTPDAQLFREGNKIRIRIEDDKAELTYKGNINNYKDVSKREEINIKINKEEVNNYIKVFSSIGYPLCFQIKKEREVYTKDNITITIDRWPIIGYLIEIEGEESKIKEVAKQMAPEKEFGNLRLKDLFKAKMDKENKTIEELKKEYYNETNFDLGKIELILKD